MPGLFDATPTLMRTANSEPIVRTAWMTARPVLNTSKRFELAPGIWIVTEPQWWPVSVLDAAEQQLPEPDVEPVKRKLPYIGWHEQAVCRTVENADSIFFGVDDEDRPTLSASMITQARAHCSVCPVARTCLNWALTARNEQADGFVTVGERFGIWAGTTGRQREKMRGKLKAGATVEELVDGWLGADDDAA